MRSDRTIELLRQGYPWAGRLRDGAVAAPTRLLGRRAFPKPIQLVLFGPGTVHSLDDAEHHHRKAMFLEVLTPDAVAALGRSAEQEWETTVRRWAGSDRVVLFDEAVHVLAASVLPWAGVPVTPDELPRLARRLAAVLDGFATPGPAYVRAVRARRQVGRWARQLVRRVRAGELRPPAGSALHAAATLRHADGRLLPERTAAVALLNVVRPTVAVAWFVAFAGKALHEHPEWRRRIADGDEVALAAFVQEVRRLYPFVPVLAARTRTAQDVLGVPLPRGGLVVLDVHGTDHDPAHWPDPDRFDPDRFLQGSVDLDTLVPQGGGDVATGHRCPGEAVTLTMLAVATRALARTPHTVPPQDLGYDLSRIPTLPRSGVVLEVGQAVVVG
jgi:fatty-acid peroxygenase